MKRIRITALLLILTLLASMLPLTVSAEGFTYEFEKNSKSLYMVSLDSDIVVYSYNAEEKLPMASLTKIMTYIVAYENIPDIENTVITVDPSVEESLSGTGSSMAGIYTGEKLTGIQLLNMMMIPSGNDAALTLATYYDKVVAANGTATANTEASASSSENTDSSTQSSAATSSAFVDLMNKKAQELGCTNTHFVNPHGLYDPEHYTTAKDMAVITKYATTLPYFSDITSSTSYTLPPTNMDDEERTVYTTNKMLTESGEEEDYYYAYAKGIKTGSLDESGYCIAASALLDGYSYLVIALGSPMVDKDGEEIDYHGEMVDAANLFRWAFTEFEMKTIAAQGDLLGDVALQYAWNKDVLQVVAKDNVSALMPSGVSVSSIIVNVDLPEKVQAPIKKGDTIGTATFTYANETIATVELVSAESIERSEIVQTVETSKEIVTSPVFLIIIGAIILVLLFYIITILVYNHKKKKMKRVKKYRNL